MVGCGFSDITQLSKGIGGMLREENEKYILFIKIRCIKCKII